VSSFIEGTGGGNMPKDQAGLTFDAEGNVVLHCTSQTQGQGHETTFPMIAAQVLGIPVEKITLKASEPDSKLIGNHTGGSRSTAGQGSACFSAATRAVDLAKRYAAEELGAETVNVTLDHGVFKGGGKTLSFIDLAKRLAVGLPKSEPHPLDVMGEVTVANTYPNGTHIAEVEVDPDTGMIEVVSYTAMDDCGNVVDHTIVEGQLMGGIAQGAGQALGEHGIYDRETGQLLTGSFMDYFMLRAGWLKDLRIGDNGVPSPTNPIGVKGVGESGTTGSIPAIANAVMSALRQVGVQGIDMPLTPARVWGAMQSAKAA
jgi:aerobic carbon-monoxide dehydrogenase large subunit